MIKARWLIFEILFQVNNRSDFLGDLVDIIIIMYICNNIIGLGRSQSLSVINEREGKNEMDINLFF